MPVTFCFFMELEAARVLFEYNPRVRGLAYAAGATAGGALLTQRFDGSSTYGADCFEKRR